MSDLILKPEGFGSKIYGLFPPSYRDDDVHTDYALKRYLDACSDGGFKYAIEDLNGLLDLANPDQATSQALPLLFQQYGLDIFYGIPEMYLRYLLPRLGEAWAKKGSIDVINFVASAIAGVRTSTWVKCDQNDNVDVDLLFEMDYAIGDYFPDTKQLCRLLERFLPFYLGINLVYVYVYHDQFTLHGKDDIKDHVVIKPLFCPTLNTGLVLNDGFTLNADTGECGRVHGNVEDVFISTKVVYHEDTSLFNKEGVDKHLDRVFRPTREQTSISGVEGDTKERLTSHFSARAGFIGTDNSFVTTKVIYREDTSLSREDGEHLDKISQYAKEQVGIGSVEEIEEHLTGQPFVEEGSVIPVDDTETLVHDTSKEVASFVFSPLLCMFTNTPSHVLNVATLDVPNEFDIVHYHSGECNTVFR